MQIHVEELETMVAPMPMDAGDIAWETFVVFVAIYAVLGC
jgi:hypothetical protein